MKIGKKLRELRKKKNLTIKQVTEKIDVGHGTYVEWEQDKKEPRANARKKLCEYFNLTEEELFGFAHNLIDVSKLPKSASCVVVLEEDCPSFTIKGLRGRREVRISPAFPA